MIKKISSLIIIYLVFCSSNVSFGQCTLSYELRSLMYSVCTCSSFRIENVRGGIGPYQFSFFKDGYYSDWNNIEPVCSGTTKFWIKDLGTGCIHEDSIVIARPTNPSQGNQYLGSAGGIWENPDNWNCGFVPGDFSDVFITSGDVSINSNVKINSLTLIGGKLTLTAGYTLTIKHFGSD